MADKLPLLILALTSLLIFDRFGLGTSDELVKCTARQEVLKTGGGFYPEFVIAYRCSGRDQHVANQNEQCVADKKQIIRKKLHYPAGAVFRYETHESCKMACVCENDGTVCPGKRETPTCQQGRTWSSTLCKCMCDDSEAKATTHGVIKDEKESSGVSIGILIASLVGELFIVVTIGYCIVKKRRSSTTLTDRSRKRSVVGIMRRTRDDIEGSVSLLGADTVSGSNELSNVEITAGS